MPFARGQITARSGATVTVTQPIKRPPESFQTLRLSCRRTRQGDAPAIFAAYAADPEVTRFLAWKTYSSVDPLAEFLGMQISAWERGVNFRFELCLKGSDSPIGAIDLRPESSRAAFGYVLARQYWGQGLMAEALGHLVNASLAQPNVFRAFAFCDLENIGSARVMEKAGMSREGILRRWHVCPNIGPEPRDCVIYARTR
jgi:ribosomal-protein-alanine N-acetyltransferase